MTNEITPEALDTIEARANAATEGPWAIWHDLDHQGFKTVGDAESNEEVKRNGFAEESNPTAHVYTDYDADFIAHAREDIPALVAELRRLRTENETLSTQDVARFVETDRLCGVIVEVKAERDALQDKIDAARNWAIETVAADDMGQWGSHEGYRHGTEALKILDDKPDGVWSSTKRDWWEPR